MLNLMQLLQRSGVNDIYTKYQLNKLLPFINLTVSFCINVFTQQKVSGKDNKAPFLVTCEGGPIKTSKFISGPLTLVNQNHFIYSFFH